MTLEEIIATALASDEAIYSPVDSCHWASPEDVTAKILAALRDVLATNPDLATELGFRPAEPRDTYGATWVVPSSRETNE